MPTRIAKNAALKNRVAEFRKRRGMTATILAEAAGLSRPTIYAIEAGDYLPNTAAALHLARVLGTTVEELFLLDDGEDIRPEPIQVVYPDGQLDESGVQLCRVGAQTVALRASSNPGFLFPADARVLPSGPQDFAMTAQPYGSAWQKRAALVIAGCDPALSYLARTLEAVGVGCMLVNTNSQHALSLLKAGHIHAGGLHLFDQQSGDYNVPFVRRLFPHETPVLITFATADHGFVVRRGNPLDVRSAADLASEQIRFVNRPKGSGSRDLLDQELLRVGVAQTAVRGYESSLPGQLAVAEAIAGGAADCGIAVRSAAIAYGLDFVPLSKQRFDICIPQPTLDLPAGRALANALNSGSLQRALAAEAEYDVAGTGLRKF